MFKNPDNKFIALCISIVVFGVIVNGLYIAPNIIHKAQLPVTTYDF